MTTPHLTGESQQEKRTHSRIQDGVWRPAQGGFRLFALQIVKFGTLIFSRDRAAAFAISDGSLAISSII